jgi:hypothetical protein
MKIHNVFDAIVIGSGPSGIFASIELIEAGLNVALVDKGGNYYTRTSTENKGLIGFGGAAMRYDANLDYSNGIPERSNLGEKVFADKKTAEKRIKEVYKRLKFFGLKKKEETDNNGVRNNSLGIIDKGILPVGERNLTDILKNVYDHLIGKNISFFEFTEVTEIVKGEGFKVRALRSEKEELIIKGKNVVIATGKLSTTRSRGIFDLLGVEYEYCDSIDIGVRIETKKRSTDQITMKCADPKIVSENKGTLSRTFCWCPGGKVIDYKFENIDMIDGQHCHDNPTDQTNFGIVTTIKFPKGTDGTKFGINYVKMFNEFTGHKAGMQMMKGLKDGNATLPENVEKNEITPTISKYSLVDLNILLTSSVKEGILKLVNKINEIYPGAIMDNSLVYGPVIERIFPKIGLDSSMESSIKGLYVVGDISGKATGVVTGAAMGIEAASRIISTI